MVSEADSSDAECLLPNQPEEAEKYPEWKSVPHVVDTADCASSVPDSSKQRSTFICTQCGLRFRRRDDYDRHKFSHTGVREYKCTEPECKRAYTNRAHLNRHIRANHTDKRTQQGKVFLCKHAGCPKTFSTDQNMRRHYDIKHVIGKCWTCTECGEKFWRKLQLKQHSIKHTGQYPHKCDICEKGFINTKSLRSHRHTHALHKCISCTAEFVRWTDLVAHRKLQHTTYYQCDMCENKFPSKKNLKMHLKLHQKRLAGDEQEVFQCPYKGCPKFYDYERNLIFHIRSKHESTHKHVCPVYECGRVLSTQQKLEQHKKMHESAARVVSRMKVPRAIAKRKDAGLPKRSTASRLANVTLDAQSERILIEMSPDRRPQLELEYQFSMDSASESEVESNSKVVLALDKQLSNIQEKIKELKEQVIHERK